MRIFPALLFQVLIAMAITVACTSNAHAEQDTITAATDNDGNSIPLPPAPTWLAQLETRYDAQLRVPGLELRTFQPEQWWKVATPLLTPVNGFSVEEVGRSAEDRPLRHVS